MRDFFSGPAMTRSTASSSSSISMTRLCRRAASSAASFTRLARSAPVKPGVCAARVSRSTPGAKRLALGVHGQDGLAAFAVGPVDDDLPVEAARPQQRRVEDVGPVGGRHDDDALVGLEAVHLDQQLVEGLLALVVAAAQTGAAVASDGVDLVDEDDAGLVLLGLVEQVAHPAGAHAHEHLHEVGAGDAEEGHPGLAGHRPGQQGLAGAGRAEQQHALGDAGPQALKALGVLEELLDLLEFLHGLVHPGHVLERDLGLIDRHPLGPRLAEAHDLAAAPLHLVHQEDEEDHHEEDGREGRQTG